MQSRVLYVLGASRIRGRFETLESHSLGESRTPASSPTLWGYPGTTDLSKVALPTPAPGYADRGPALEAVGLPKWLLRKSGACLRVNMRAPRKTPAPPSAR